MNDGECRRVMLLSHFAEQFNALHCRGTCDNCKKGGPVRIIRRPRFSSHLF